MRNFKLVLGWLAMIGAGLEMEKGKARVISQARKMD